MRQFLFILVCSSSALFAGNSYVTWADAEIVTEGTTYFNMRPRLALTTGNIPVIIWGRNTTGKIYASRWDGTDFSLPVQLNPNGTEAFTSDWAGPEIAGKGDTVFVVFKLLPEDAKHVYILRSTDGGATFGDTVRVENLQVHQSRFPSVSIGTGGNPIVTFMKFLSGWIDPEYSVTRSLDGGQTFEPDTSGTYLAPGEVCDCCPAAITSSGDIHVLCFRNNDHNLRDAWLAISSDNGTSFSTAGDIDDNGWIIFSCPASGPESIIAGNNIFTVWMSGASGSTRVFLGKSDFSANPLSTNMMVNGNVPADVNQNFPKIAGNGDTIGVVWHETYQGGSFILFKHSLTGINGLSEVDTIAAKANNTLKNPEISYANGTFHIVYQDDQGRKVLYNQGKLMVSSTTSIKEPINDLDVQVNPNPFSSHTLISWNNPERRLTELRIYDEKGSVVYDLQSYQPSYQIKSSNLPSGIYMVELKIGPISSLVKLVVK